MYYLFKTKNWDALTRRLPLAICVLVIIQVALGNNRQFGPARSLLAMVAIAILLLGTVLPALSGVMLWIGRRNPARMWAAEQTDARPPFRAFRTGVDRRRCQCRRHHGGI